MHTAREFDIHRTRESIFDFQPSRDLIAIEAPLEVRLGYGPVSHRHHISWTVTMRTPGDDSALVTGLLYAEGIIAKSTDIDSLSFEAIDETGAAIAHVDLHPTIKPAALQLERRAITTSACGACSKTSVESLNANLTPLARASTATISPNTLVVLPEKLRKSQKIFQQTGGIHAVGLFDTHGQLRRVAEDVGRHNALDKLVGHNLIEATLPLTESILLLSGRASFELVQKAWRTGLPTIAAIGAPSSLAVELARTAGITLIGFLRDDRFNIYSGWERLMGEAGADEVNP